MQDDEALFADALTHLTETERGGLFGVISWAAAQPEEEEEATLRVIAALTRERRKSRSRD